MHNSADRLILRLSRGDSAMPLLCILPVTRRIDFKLLVFTYKAGHGDEPEHLSDIVCSHTPARALRSVSNNMTTVLRTHVKAEKSSFAVDAASLWNTLSNDIKMSDTLSSFKARIKTHVYRLSFFFKHGCSCTNLFILLCINLFIYLFINYNFMYIISVISICIVLFLQL